MNPRIIIITLLLFISCSETKVNTKYNDDVWTSLYNKYNGKVDSVVIEVYDSTLSKVSLKKILKKYFDANNNIIEHKVYVVNDSDTCINLINKFHYKNNLLTKLEIIDFEKDGPPGDTSVCYYQYKNGLLVKEYWSDNMNYPFEYLYDKYGRIIKMEQATQKHLYKYLSNTKRQIDIYSGDKYVQKTIEEFNKHGYIIYRWHKYLDNNEIEEEYFEYYNDTLLKKHIRYFGDTINFTYKFEDGNIKEIKYQLKGIYKIEKFNIYKAH